MSEGGNQGGGNLPEVEENPFPADPSDQPRMDLVPRDVPDGEKLEGAQAAVPEGAPNPTGDVGPEAGSAHKVSEANDPDLDDPPETQDDDDSSDEQDIPEESFLEVYRKTDFGPNVDDPPQNQDEVDSPNMDNQPQNQDEVDGPNMEIQPQNQDPIQDEVPAPNMDDPPQNQDPVQAEEGEAQDQPAPKSFAWNCFRFLSFLCRLSITIVAGTLNRVAAVRGRITKASAQSVKIAIAYVVKTTYLALSACSMISRFLQNPQQNMEAIRNRINERLRNRFNRRHALYNEMLNFVDAAFHRIIPENPDHPDLALVEVTVLKRIFIIHVNLFLRIWRALKAATSERWLFGRVLEAIHFFQRTAEKVFFLSTASTAVILQDILRFLGPDVVN